MTKKFYIRKVFLWDALLTLVLILGFATAPSITLACGLKSEKHCCCKNETSGRQSAERHHAGQHPEKKSDKKDCCKKSKHNSEDKDGGCAGKCGDKSCHCPAFNYSLILPVYFEVGNPTFDFLDEKQNFYYLEIYLSSGFYSIWSPPNIS